MTIKDTFTPMADHLRSEYGTSDLLTVDQIKAGIDGLHVQNYLTAGQTLSYPADSPTKALVGIDTDTWNKSFLGKNITISFDAKWSGYKNGRIGIEYSYLDKGNVTRYYGSWLYPNTEQGSQHVATTLTIDTNGLSSFEETHMYAQTNADAKVEITNPKVVINPMGGVTKPNLFDLSKISLNRTQREGTLFTFDSKGAPAGDLNFLLNFKNKLATGLK